MKVFLTGATGFIGRALVLALLQKGHSVVAWVRSPEKARAGLGGNVELLPITPEGNEELEAALEQCDAVINLAGEPLFQGRWNPRRKNAIYDSRVSLTTRLVEAMKRVQNPPGVLLSGSAVGYYGDRGDDPLSEDEASGADFLAKLCKAWEHAALALSGSPTRVVCLRTGIVLGCGGGALEQLAAVFRTGLGGPLGAGRQFVPWIHLQDCVALILRALDDDRLEGPLNLVSPAPVTNAELAKALGRALRRPAFLPAPGLLLRLTLGEGANALLASQRCLADKAKAHGFSYRFESLDSALDDLLTSREVSLEPLRPGLPAPMGDADYLRQRKPTRYLVSQTVVDAPLAEVFPFFSQPTNLGLLTPPKLDFQIRRADPTMCAGAAIQYRLRVFGLRIGWHTRIERWEAGRHFVDSQIHGPYRSWWHEHHFSQEGGRTVMEDRVYYSVPGGIVGRLVHRILIAAQLRASFNYRAAAIRFRFGPAPGERSSPIHDPSP